MTNFIFREEWTGLFEELPDEQRLRAYDAIVNYAFRGVVPTGDMAIATAVIRKQIDADREKYERTCSNRRDAAIRRSKKASSPETAEQSAGAEAHDDSHGYHAQPVDAPEDCRILAAADVDACIMQGWRDHYRETFGADYQLTRGSIAAEVADMRVAIIKTAEQYGETDIADFSRRMFSGMYQRADKWQRDHWTPKTVAQQFNQLMRKLDGNTSTTSDSRSNARDDVEYMRDIADKLRS